MGSHYLTKAICVPLTGRGRIELEFETKVMAQSRVPQRYRWDDLSLFAHYIAAGCCEAHQVDAFWLSANAGADGRSFATDLPDTALPLNPYGCNCAASMLTANATGRRMLR
jgi:hypothetical protein